VRFVKQYEGSNWRTDDAASLYIAGTGHDTDPPLEFRCFVIGHTGIVRPETIQVRTAELEFLAAGLFGPPRDKTAHHVGWTGDAYKFGIYARRSISSRHDVVILRTDGRGFHAYIDMSLTAAELWRYVSATCSWEMLWNICSCVAHTHDSAHEYGRQMVTQAFLEGRLKRKRRRGIVRAYLVPPAMAGGSTT